jgi:hypothetical protein
MSRLGKDALQANPVIEVDLENPKHIADYGNGPRHFDVYVNNVLFVIKGDEIVIINANNTDSDNLRQHIIISDANDSVGDARMDKEESEQPEEENIDTDFLDPEQQNIVYQNNKVQQFPVNNEFKHECFRKYRKHGRIEEVFFNGYFQTFKFFFNLFTIP